MKFIQHQRVVGMLGGVLLAGVTLAGTPASAQNPAETLVVHAGTPDDTVIRGESVEISGPAAGTARPAAPWSTHPAQTSRPDVTHAHGAPSRGRAQPATEITCSSVNRRRQYCHTGSAQGDARLVRQLSRSACIEGRDWEQTDGNVWVDNGCRATFTIE